ncbi:MAG: hypothetical protein JXA30_18930 [Deltaproteobacteria bacterium]|nr:hypothetical protein [Deltaproteobacteria bacterium]
MTSQIKDRLPNAVGRCPRLVTLMAIVSAVGLTLLACSSDDSKQDDSPQAGSASSSDNATTPSGGASEKPSTQTTGGTSQSGGAGGTTLSVDAGVDGGKKTANTPKSDAQTKPTTDASPTADSSAPETGPEPDCTPVIWENPGNVPNPEVIKVETNAGRGWAFGRFKDIDQFDYVEEEFFFSGTTPAAYTSRILVRRPKDPAKFTGTVFAEWLNVSGGIDFATEWTYSREYFMRAGHVHVSVSAQAVGANALKNTCDAERYAPIVHPGDNYANNIFSQAGVAIRLQSERILGLCMPVHAVIAIGQSQSAMRLADYINRAQGPDQVYDGIVPHSGMEPSSNNTPVPVFIVTTQSEGNMRLTTGPNLAKWVLAGATHSDVFETTRGLSVAEDIGWDVGAQECVFPGNTYPSWRIYNAVWDWMHRWVRFGEKPPEAPLLTGALDEHGNTLGGVRLPEIDVPTAAYTTGNTAADPGDFVSAMACVFMGATEAFTPEKLLQLYPTHDDYVQKYTAAADEALAKGYILQEDYTAAIEEAKNAPIPR